jgi:hypothetical protein
LPRTKRWQTKFYEHGNDLADERRTDGSKFPKEHDPVSYCCMHLNQRRTDSPLLEQPLAVEKTRNHLTFTDEYKYQMHYTPLFEPINNVDLHMRSSDLELAMFHCRLRLDTWMSRGELRYTASWTYSNVVEKDALGNATLLKWSGPVPIPVSA